MDPVCTADAREETVSGSGVLADYGGWLDRQRGLAPVTIHNYCWHAEQFLAALPRPMQVSVSLLDAGAVTAFMVGYCRDRNTNSAKSMARSVRSFLRFAHATGRTPAELRGAVPSSSAGTWPRCRGPCRQRTLSACWQSPRVAGSRPRRATTRSCCCWPGSGCGEASSQAFASTTSTGGPENSPSSARAAGSSGCPCRPSREKRSSRGWPTGGPGARRGRCSPRSDRPAGRCRLGRSVMSWAAHAGGPGLPGSARTGCVTRWPRPCCGPGRRSRRWGRCCATGARGPPRSTPRSMRLPCDRSPGPGPAQRRRL